MIYACCDELRREAVRQHPTLNGIDFLEVIDRAANDPAERQRKLAVHFLKPLGTLTLASSNVRIEGGERIQNIKVVAAVAGAGPNAHVLTVEVDQAGDFSPYTLRLVTDALNDAVPAKIDPQLAAIEFSFKVECPSPFDCAPQSVCPPAPAAVPDIDYLAKDFSSFRRLMLDRMAVLMPAWQERNPADLGIMLVEALAYSADQLSYQQDAVATEAYLRTARQRISLRRHARLMDYFISEGCNARTWVQLQVSADVIGAGPDHPAIPRGTRITTQIANQKTVIDDDPRVYEQADIVFETLEPLPSLFLDHNELRFYTWSDQRCCLAKGATRATLEGHHAKLAAGTILILEEVRGAETGAQADADPTRRHAIRLQAVTVTAPDNSPLTDPVTGNQITEIVWSDEDALPLPFCLSAKTSDGYQPYVSVARGNVVLADHGLTLRARSAGDRAGTVSVHAAGERRRSLCPADPQPVFTRFRPQLAQAPLTHAAPLYDHGLAARSAMQWSLREVQPVVTLTSTAAAITTVWTARRDLLNSSASAEEFVAEIDNDGAATIRFGDDVHGRRPEPGTEFFATYRVGNGRAGNIGADALAHIAKNIPEITAGAQSAAGPRGSGSRVAGRRAPARAGGLSRAGARGDAGGLCRGHRTPRGCAARRGDVSLDRQLAHRVSDRRSQRRRAGLTRVRERHPQSRRALSHGGTRSGSRRARSSWRWKSTSMSASPADHFRSDVERELFDVLSNQDLPDGRRGLFHPDNFTFGQPVYLSALYAAAHQVAGVESVEVRTFQRLGVRR